MVYAPTVQPGLNKKVTVHTLRERHQRNEKFAVIALYDAPMATIAEKSGAEIVLVGDSLGMTVMGHDSTLPVTMEHMIYHTEAVSRGSRNSLIIVDMPFMAYATPAQTLENSARLMRAGAHMVKLEGGQWLAPTIAMLSERGIPVCAHLGLTPQSFHKLGGFRVQGRGEKDAARILDDALRLEDAGADVVLLECIPAELGKAVTQALQVPTIGIGAGKDTSAQVLVINDILGITERPPKFSKNFLAETGAIPDALLKYVTDVKAGRFPADEHLFVK